jgi:AbrB family looped-hinge helix DNA binding protein
MEVSITKMSRNGQVVIPSPIRQEAKVKPGTKFLVFSGEGEIFLRPVRSEELLLREIELVKRIDRMESKMKRQRSSGTSQLGESAGKESDGEPEKPERSGYLVIDTEP